jgi:hypothetical protein
MSDATPPDSSAALNRFAAALDKLLAAAAAQWSGPSEQHYTEVMTWHNAARMAAPPGVSVPPLDGPEGAGLPVVRVSLVEADVGGEGGPPERRPLAAYRPLAAGNKERWRAWSQEVAALRDAAIATCPAAETRGPSPNGGADSSADSGEKTQKILPNNDNVVRLARRVRDREEGMSIIDVARAFVVDDLHQEDPKDRLAKSLLRQLRRFPHLLT